MATIENNLYPPLVLDTIPAFIRTQTCRIYFSLSEYNSKQDIRSSKGVQVSLVNQTTNASALKNSLYTSGIMLADLIEDQNKNDDYNYYIEIKTSDLQKNEFEINQFYIAQLRFCSSSDEVPTPPSTGAGLATWLYENRKYFSEWSKLCLLKGIEQPHILINNLVENEKTILSNSLNYIVGSLFYDNDKETEYLKSYNINIYENNLSVFKSDEIYTSQYSPNKINYEIKYNLLREKTYTLKITYTTNNLYTNSVSYNFEISQEDINQLDGNIHIVPDRHNGRIKFDIDFEYLYGVKTNKNLIIKRASSRTNFNIWETVKKIPHTIEMLRHVWYDNTIQSGVWYKYRVQEDEIGGKIYESEQPIMCVFEDIFLSDGSRQLKIQFNPVISDYKYNVMDSQQVTLGSKYPFIKRNGDNFFRTFNIGGLISAFMDRDDWYCSGFSDNGFHTQRRRESFTSPFELYQDSKSLYQEYNDEHEITSYEDSIYEREFRKKVSDFLYANNIKLFRSNSEGNILIRLMNVSFQPVDSLGRRLYSFSATAVEMDELNIINYMKYNLFNKYYYYYKTGSISGSFKGEEYIVNKILQTSSFLEKTKDEFKIFRIKAQLNSSISNVVFCVKVEGNQVPLRYIIPSSKVLQLSFPDNEAIEECYFSGVHLNENNFSFTGQYYTSTDAIKNPVLNGVYYILDPDKAYKINNYIAYNKYGRLLTTEEKETSVNIVLDYSLLTEKGYKKYIYYNNTWYPFSENNDVLMDINATINYYYEIKEAN